MISEFFLSEGFSRSRPQVPQGCPMGPKFWAQKFSHIILRWCYFMHFVDLFCKKWRKMGKTGHFWHFWLLLWDLGKMTCFSHFSPFFAKQIHKTHKITSSEDDMRTFLSPKFWSHGTLLGYLGPGSRKAFTQKNFRNHFLVIWGPNDPPVLVRPQEK